MAAPRHCRRASARQVRLAVGRGEPGCVDRKRECSCRDERMSWYRNHGRARVDGKNLPKVGRDDLMSGGRLGASTTASLPGGEVVGAPMWGRHRRCGRLDGLYIIKESSTARSL